MPTLPCLAGSNSDQREASVKATYLNTMRGRGSIGSRTILANELVLGASGVRADLVVFTNELIGVEIKTEFDTLRRLEKQLAAYRKICDRVVLIVAERHLRHSLAAAVDGVDVWQIDTDGKLLALQEHLPRRAGGDPTLLLTSVEKRRLDREAARWRACSAERVATAARHLISSRFAATSKIFWSSVGRRRIRPSDLALLSRFKPIRDAAALHAEKQRLAWIQWEDHAHAVFEPMSSTDS